MDVSENSGTPKSSILIGFSIINHPFWDTPIFDNTNIIANILVSLDLRQLVSYCDFSRPVSLATM